MITVVNKSELWHLPGTQAPGEIHVIYLNIVGKYDQYIANMKVFGRLKEDGRTRRVTAAIALYGGPGYSYMGYYTPAEIENWLNAMGANKNAFEDACRRAGWRK